jgi:hypothetical protein
MQAQARGPFQATAQLPLSPGGGEAGRRGFTVHGPKDKDWFYGLLIIVVLGICLQSCQGLSVIKVEQMFLKSDKKDYFFMYSRPLMFIPNLW